jgi:hypothetical protein
MKGNDLPIFHRIGYCLGFLIFIVFFICNYSRSDTLGNGQVQLISPPEKSKVIGRKPLIECAFRQPEKMMDLVVLLDGIDITAMLQINPEGFQYKPVRVLEPGIHILTIYGKTVSGDAVEEEFSFLTRHFKRLEKAYFENELTGVYETVLTKTDDVEKRPNWKVESNLSTDASLKEKGWDVAFRSNLRYLDQNLSVEAPLKKGLDLIDYLLTAT